MKTIHSPLLAPHDGTPRPGARIAALGEPKVLVREGDHAVAGIGDNVVSVLSAFVSP